MNHLATQVMFGGTAPVKLKLGLISADGLRVVLSGVSVPYMDDETDNRQVAAAMRALLTAMGGMVSLAINVRGGKWEGTATNIVVEDGIVALDVFNLEYQGTDAGFVAGWLGESGFSWDDIGAAEQSIEGIEYVGEQFASLAEFRREYWELFDDPEPVAPAA